MPAAVAATTRPRRSSAPNSPQTLGTLLDTSVRMSLRPPATQPPLRPVDSARTMPRRSERASDASPPPSTAAAAARTPGRAGAGPTATSRYGGAARPKAPTPVGKTSAPAAGAPPATIDFSAPFSLHLEQAEPPADGPATGAPLETRAEEADADRQADAIAARLPPAAEAGGTFAQHRHRFEAAMGVPLDHVRVREADGGDSARLGARAHAVGAELAFAPGAFRPGTPDGDLLIAHELAHTLQPAGPVRRKIIVGGHAWDAQDIELFLDRLKAKYPDVAAAPPADRERARQRRPNVNMRLTLRQMGSQDETFEFASVVELERLMVMRERTVANLDQPASCQYPDEDAQPQLDPRFWQKLAGRFSWRVKPGVKASAAIKSIYAEGDEPWRLECFTMTTAAVYKGQLDAIGDEQFDRHHPAGLVLSTDKQVGGINALVREGVLEVVQVGSVSELLAGDWVYFRNDERYRDKHPDGYWQGENTVCMGHFGGEVRFRGFGVADANEQTIRQELADQFNEDSTSLKLDHPLQREKTTADKIPGPLLDRVRRPARSAVESR